MQTRLLFVPENRCIPAMIVAENFWVRSTVRGDRPAKLVVFVRDGILNTVPIFSDGFNVNQRYMLIEEPFDTQPVADLSALV